MELNKIEALLEKYMEAETSIAEEQELQMYFASGNVAPHLQEYIPLFSYFKKEKEIEYSREIKLEEKNRNSKGWYQWIAVAASIAIIGGIFITTNNNNSLPQDDLGTYEDPEVALQKTKDVLNMVSAMMNTGQENLVYLNEFGETTNRIIK